MGLLVTDEGLDLNFSRTKAALGMKPQKLVQDYPEDPMFEKMANAISNLDYQQYLTRFKWNNLPEGMDSELFERVMFFSGSAMFFYIKELDKFYFLPYGMSGEKEPVGIDFYGRFNKIKPYSFNGATDSRGEKNADGKKSTADLYLSTQVRDNIKDVPFVRTEEEARKIYENGAGICWDYTPGYVYYNNSRNRVSRSFIKFIKKALIQVQSAMTNASGFNMFAADGESNNDIMQMQIDQINQDREHGKLAAVVSNVLGKIENLQSNAPAAMADFWSCLQSIDNLRLKTMGIRNDGVQQKSQYQNIQEQTVDINDSLQVYWNSFMERIKFSAIVNSIWDLDIYPEPLLLPTQGEEQPQGEEKPEGDESQAQGGTND